MHNDIYDNNSNICVIQLKEEHMDITKKLIQTSDFKIYKETYIKEQTFKIPITHVDLIIEPQTSIDKNSNSIRIPLMEERVEFNKFDETLEDIKIYKHTFEEIVPVETMLKKEDINISNLGDVIIKSK